MKKLSDLCLHITDGEHGTVNDDSNGEFYLLSNKNIENGEIVISDEDRKINEQTYKKIQKRINLEKNDILISTVGTIGKTSIICDGNINYVFQRSVGIIKPDPNLINPLFLKYQLDTPSFQKRLINLSKGAVQKCLFIGDLEQLDINLPNMETQNKIVEVLSNIDNKIRVNNKINNNLDRLLMTTYNRWFLEFNFPDNNGRPYKSSGGKMVWNEKIKRDIPLGWNVTPINDVLLLLKDGTHNPPKRVEKGIPLLTGTMFSQNFLEYSKVTYISEDDYKFIHSQYAPQESDIILTKIGTLGNVNYIRRQDIPLAIHCNSALLRFPELMRGSFSLYYCKSDEFQKRLRAEKGQSVQEFCSLDRIGSILMIVPDRKIIESYNKKMNPLLNKMELVCEENNQLISIRDFLLPMLMNGQINVDDIEI